MGWARSKSTRSMKVQFNLLKNPFKEWRGIPRNTVEKLILRMSLVCQALINVSGGYF
jgi:hypothetical protein